MTNPLRSRYRSTAEVRALIQGLLDVRDCMSQEEIQRHLRLDYHTVNRALNHPANFAIGETPFARTDGDTSQGGPRWVWYAVTPSNPLTQRAFDVKVSTAHTQMTKARDNLVAPAIANGSVASGDSEAVDESLEHLDSAIKSLAKARATGARKFELAQREREVENRSAEVAEAEARVAKAERDLQVARRALIKQNARPASKLTRKR